MGDETRKRTPLTNAELDELAIITPDDIQRAVDRFNEVCSPEFRGLLEARAHLPREHPKKRPK